jgi:hypothetical protein
VISTNLEIDLEKMTSKKTFRDHEFFFFFRHFSSDKHQQKTIYSAVQCAQVQEYSDDFISTRFSDQEIWHYNRSRIMNQRIYEHYASFFERQSFFVLCRSIEMKKNLIRVCMFVTKRIFIDDLKYLFRSKNVMIVQIRLHEIHYLHLHNVYNESNILSFFALQNLRLALLKSSLNEHFRDHIIMKNLNIHHSSWDDSTTRSNSRSLEMLLLMNEFRLQSNFSRKTSTYVHFQKSESIIDMCLTIENLNDRIWSAKHAQIWITIRIIFSSKRFWTF